MIWTIFAWGEEGLIILVFAMSMQAVLISTPGDATVLNVGPVALPVPAAGEVLIKVHAAGLNRLDILQRQGKYPPPPGASEILGLDVAGEIVSAGPGVDLAAKGFKIGDAVCALLQGGGYAQFAAAPLDVCLPVPKGFTMVEAASLPETFFTVWSNVFQRGHLSAGETLLVQGGSSGIGVSAIQIAKQLGHTVWVTAGSDEKCRACEALGADRGINYRTEDFAAVVKEISGGRGVDVILDMVAGDYVPREMNCLADDGRIVIIALQRGASAPIDLSQFLRRRLTVTGSGLRARDVAFKAQIARELLTKVWPLLESGKIKPVIYKSFPMAEATAAHQLMESSDHVGKIMLQIV
ncbi:NAD(P)H quinone oxidoreductase [Achlya hypogyna]|uniref:NAD(P)H quinone oxidoreductase n=1 Tax=Achlya hypogyna TaxID=1202772 RepID=A0A1V9ZMA8_ACHHY|nr:NAD(P)H quinone oxidoreductase [Achlya hypogyna]